MCNNFRSGRVVTFWTILAFLGSLCIGVAAWGAADKPGTNPAYAEYDFGNEQHVVRFGTQPLGVLHAVVPEVMKRDKILASYLESQDMVFSPLPFYNGPDINHFMLQDKLDIAMAGDFPTLTLATQGDIEVVAISKRDKASVVSSDTYTNIVDLKGKRIAYPAGTSSHLGLLVVIEAAGLHESDMQMIDMNIEKLTGALVSGEIDAFAGWEPVPSAALAANKRLKIISQFLNSDFTYWRKGFAEQKPEVARHVLAAYVRAIYWLKANDANLSLGAKWSIAGTEAFLGKQSKLSLAEFKQRIRENLALVGNTSIPFNEFDEGGYLYRAFKLLQKKGKMKKEAQWEQVQNSLRAELVREVLTDLEKYETLTFDYIVN